MAKEVIEIEVVSNYKQALKEANAELLKARDTFGETSTEALQAAKRVGELRDAIADAKSQAAAFEGGGSFRAITQAGSVAASGFEAATGAMALFGAESESVQAALLKVQSVMALSQGLSGLEEAGEAYKNLKGVVVATYTSLIASKTADTTATVLNTTATEANTTATFGSVLQKGKNLAITALQTTATYAQAAATNVVTGAQWLWNAAMSANPIGAVAVAVAGLVAGIYLLVDAMATSSAETARNEKLIRDNSAAFDKQKAATEKSSTALQKNNQYQYDLAKANGASSEELRKLALQQAKATEELNLNNTMLARNTFLQTRNKIALLEAQGASEEQINKLKKLSQAQFDEFEKQRAGYYKSKQDVLDVQRKANVEEAQEETNAREKRKEANKKATDDKLSEKRRELEEIKKIQNETTNYLDDVGKTDRQKELEAVDDKYKSQLDLLRKYGKDTTDLELKILGEKSAIDKKYDDKDKQEKDAKAAQDKQDAERVAQEKLDFMKQFKEEEKTFSDMKTNEEIEALRLANEAKLNQQMEADLKKGAAMGLSEDELQKIRDSYAGKKRENDEAAAKAEEDLAEKKTQVLFNIGQEGVNMLDSLSKIGLVKGKAAQAAQKALTLAQIGKDTASAISSLVKGSESTGAAAGPAYLPVKIATFAAGLAPILANVAKAKQLLSSDNGGNVSGGSGGAAPAIPAQAPTFNVVGNSGVNQLAQTIGEQTQQQAAQGQQPIQAYVVSKEVTTAQSLDRNIITNASMG